LIFDVQHVDTFVRRIDPTIRWGAGRDVPWHYVHGASKERAQSNNHVGILLFAVYLKAPRLPTKALAEFPEDEATTAHQATNRDAESQEDSHEPLVLCTRRITLLAEACLHRIVLNHQHRPLLPQVHQLILVVVTHIVPGQLTILLLDANVLPTQATTGARRGRTRHRRRCNRC